MISKIELVMPQIGVSPIIEQVPSRGRLFGTGGNEMEVGVRSVFGFNHWIINR